MKDLPTHEGIITIPAYYSYSQLHNIHTYHSYLRLDNSKQVCYNYFRYHEVPRCNKRNWWFWNYCHNSHKFK